MKLTRNIVMGLPQLDIHTVSEDWALMVALEQQWMLLAESVGKKPSEWLDSKGDRMYGAVMYLSTWFDLEDTIQEDDDVETTTEITAIRKPHSLGTTTFTVNGKAKGGVTILTSFIKRHVKGSNKKFSKVRDLWTAEDFNGDAVDELLELHHATKAVEQIGEVVQTIEVNRIQDFNVADFMYFKNYVRFAKAAEWVYNRPKGTYMNAEREVFYYGNVDDGVKVSTTVGAREDGRLQTAHLAEDGRRICLTVVKSDEVNLVLR